MADPDHLDAPSATRNSNASDLRELIVRFGGDTQTDDSVPLNLMMQSLAELRKVASRLSSYQRLRGKNAKGTHTRLPKSIFELRCRALQPNCVEVLIEVGRPVAEVSGQYQQEQLGWFRQSLQTTIESANAGEVDAILELVPDPRYSNPILASLDKLQDLQSLLPLHITNAQRRTLYRGARTSSRPGHLQAMAARQCPPPPPSEVLFTGYLSNIGVKDSDLVLDLIDGDSLKVPYATTFAELDIEVSPKTLVQVSGTGPHRTPHTKPQLATVHEICAVDQSDISLKSIELDNQPYVAEPPLNFSVQFDTDEGFFEVSGEFDIRFAEDTREEVLTRLTEEIEYSWAVIAKEDDDSRLSPRAGEVRTEMRERLQRRN